MSLATRCTSCGIVFRVVQDQLKVSEGWVRCGRCDAVFNALEGLFDLDLEQPPMAVRSEPSPASGYTSTPTNASTNASTTPTIAAASMRRSEHVSSATRWGDGPAPSERVLQRDRNEFEDARFNTELMLDTDSPQVPPDEVIRVIPIEPRFEPIVDLPAMHAEATPAAEAFLIEPATAEPSFMQQADRDARWQRPEVRIGLWLASALLMIVLAGQSIHHFRDAVSARLPVMQPALTAWCHAVGCTVDAPHRIQDLSVESSGLTQIGIGSNAFKLSVSLRNRGSMPVSIPWVELSVSDSNGQLLTRKALRPVDFGITGSVIQPKAELPLQLTLASTGAKVSGYTVELFYP